MSVGPTPARRGKRFWWSRVGIVLGVACIIGCWPRGTGLVRYIVPAGYEGYLAIHVDDGYDTRLPTVHGVTVIRWDSTGLLRVRSAEPLHAWHTFEVADTQGNVLTCFVPGPTESGSEFSGNVHWYYVGASPEDAARHLYGPDHRQLGWLRERGVQKHTSVR